MDALVFLVVVLLVVGAIALVWAIASHVAKVAKRIDAAWAQAAEALGGRFIPVHGPWYNRKPRRLEVDVDGLQMLVDHYTVSTGKSSVTYTRLTCRAIAPPGMELQVYRKHALSGLGQALGFQDVPTGQGQFDEAFTIKSNAPDLVPIWVGPEVRKALGRVTDYGFSLNNGEVTARKTGLEQDPKVLVAAVKTAALLGARGRRVLEKWRSLAAELGGSCTAKHEVWMPDGSTSIQAPWHDVPITIDLVTERAGWLGNDHALFTRVRGRRRPGERFYLGYDEPPAELLPVTIAKGLPWKLFSSDPNRTTHRLTDEILEALSTVGAASVEANGQYMTLLIHGALVASAPAAAAVDVVGRLCSEEQFGPYR